MEKEPDLINSKRFEIAQGIASGLAHLHKIDLIHKDRLTYFSQMNIHPMFDASV